MNTMHWVYWVTMLLMVAGVAGIVLGLLWWLLKLEGRRYRSHTRVIRYNHHGRMVAVRAHLQGQHRAHCLCYSCDRFAPLPDGRAACPIAQATFDNCVKYNTVTPVWECPEYTGK